jgi:hypothetical protein
MTSQPWRGPGAEIWSGPQLPGGVRTWVRNVIQLRPWLAGMLLPSHGDPWTGGCRTRSAAPGTRDGHDPARTRATQARPAHRAWL